MRGRLAMRIIGGIYRSRLIEMPKGVEIRPTQDKVRQAVFNILRDVNGMTVLELFAGSGAFGIEAISRGAGHATFIDNDPKCIQAIRKNLAALKVDPALYDIIRLNALEAASKLEKEQKKFDLVIMDPPYYRELAKKCLITLNDYDILAQSALVVVERFKRDELPTCLTALELITERAYSDTIISIFRTKNGN